MANHILLETVELTQTTQTITFDNIPQSGYTDLKFLMSMRATTSSGNDSFDLLVNFNGSSANKTTISLRGDGSGLNWNAIGDRLLRLVNPSDYTANTFSNVELYVPNYTSSSNKSFTVDAVIENNATSSGTIILAGLWSSTAAITSMSFTPNGTSAYFTAGTTISLYGVAATGTTPAVAPKATGGNIVANDGTYWYHAFLTSGTFTPQTSISCDALVIAGGGSGGNGGNSGGAGGGGAGGLLYFSSQSLTTQSYTCTVGAGGAAVLTAGGVARNGNTGNDSQFGSLTLVKGGGYGGGGVNGTSSGTGGNGGSGGGAGRWNGPTSVSGGIATSGQGNNGGASTSPSSSGRGSGGGGGAGAVGTTGADVSNNDGSGGAGLNTWSAWATATNTGVSGYYAGGGGGSSIYTANGIGGAGGGGTGPQASNTTQTAGSGITNTGGGGAGIGGPDSATYVHTSGSGGSGIIIIRYAM